MCVTICGRFCPDEGAVAGYGNRIRAKYTAKWGVQIAGMIFQTRSRARFVRAFCYEPVSYFIAASHIHKRHFALLTHTGWSDHINKFVYSCTVVPCNFHSKYC